MMNADYNGHTSTSPETVGTDATTRALTGAPSFMLEELLNQGSSLTEAVEILRLRKAEHQMNSVDYQDKAKWAVVDTINNVPNAALNKVRMDGVTDGNGAWDIDDVYVVWFAKTLGNWKALISTDRVSGAYFEVTYNGAKRESYVDLYKKAFNIALPDQAKVLVD